MSDEPYSIMQACEIHGCDSNQLYLKYINNKHWLVCLKNTEVIEAELKEIDKDVLSWLSKLAKEELKKECFLTKNGNCELIISDIKVLTQNDKFKTLWLVRNKKTLCANGFFELCEHCFDKPTKSIDNLFSGEKLILERLKCDKEGHSRYLKNPCIISLKDIYLPPEIVKKISNHQNTSPKDKNSSMTKARVSKEENIPVVKDGTAKPAAIKPSNSGYENSEPLRSELEKIALKSPPSHLNKSTLWKAFINSVKDDNTQSSFEYYNSKSVKEKDSTKVWTYEMATYHLKKIVEWVEQQTNI